MYTPRGFGVSELGDIEVVADGDDLHLFHLTLPTHDVVQHAVSRDGLAWSPLPAALRTGDPGDIDDDQIWTMSVTPRPDRDGYLMLYTALTTADGGRVQRIAAATSDDLLTWRKSAANPVSEADPRWYESVPERTPFVSWRDPKLVRIGDTFFATLCAREKQGPLPRRGCVGLLASDDLATWEARAPLFAPQRYWDLECPQLFHLRDSSPSGRWYLTAAIMEDRTQRYWAAGDAAGPFRMPAGGDLLAPPGHYAARVIRWRDMNLLFAWHQPKLHKGWMTSSRTVDWVEARNPFGKFLAPPLRLTAREDGSLALGSYPGWDEYRDGGWRAPEPATGTLFAETAVDNPPPWRINRQGAMDVLTAGALADDFVLEGILTLDGARGGLGVRLDAEGNGLYVELAPGSRRVTLQRWGSTRNDHDGTHRHEFDELQAVTLPAQMKAGAAMPIRLLVVGPYVEVSLAGEVAIAAMTGKPRAGAWGMWVEDGSCGLTEARWAPMRRPVHHAPSRFDRTVEAAIHD